MVTLTKFVTFCIWVVVVALTLLIVGVSLFGAWKIVQATDWQSSINILATIGSLIICIILTLVVGGFLLWVIRNKILPSEQDEQKEKVNQAVRRW